MTTKKEFSGRFEETGKNIDNMVSNASETLRKERQDLKNRWNALDKKRSDVSDDDNNAWDDVKDEMEEGWKDIQDTYDDMKDNFRKDGHEGHKH